MFCYQCEQAAGGKGCTKIGVCGKQPDVAAFRICSFTRSRGLAQVAPGGPESRVSSTTRSTPFICKALFSTLTNVNFDAQRIADLIKKTVALRDELKGKVCGTGGRPI